MTTQELTPEELTEIPTVSNRIPERVDAIQAGSSRATNWALIYKKFMSQLFSGIFYLIALILALYGVYHLLVDLVSSQREVISIVVSSINTLVVALAMFELGAGISKEYSSDDEDENIFINIRRTITRFVGTVCIALVLEALIMIIKYSQLELAGNLYYPVAIMVGAGVLLISLGGFLGLTRGHTE